MIHYILCIGGYHTSCCSDKSNKTHGTFPAKENVAFLLVAEGGSTVHFYSCSVKKRRSMHEKVVNGPKNVIFIGNTIHFADFQVSVLLLELKIV